MRLSEQNSDGMARFFSLMARWVTLDKQIAALPDCGERLQLQIEVGEIRALLGDLPEC